MNDKNTNNKIGRNMIWLMWAILIGLATVFFNKILDDQKNPNKNVQSSINEQGVKKVVLTRNRFGQYITSGKINGQKVIFMIDTGASDISIPIAVANKLNLKKGRTVQYETANGIADAYQTQLNSVSIGDIILNNTRASINPNVQYEEILLGMSFLKDLEFIQKGNKLTLKQNLLQN